MWMKYAAETPSRRCFNMPTLSLFSLKEELVKVIVLIGEIQAAVLQDKNVIP